MTEADVSTLSYEEALGELDGLIAQLEGGEVRLEEAIRQYERGSRLAQRCAELLDRTEAAVTQLVVGSSGAVQERPFTPLSTPAGDARPDPVRPARPTLRPVAPPPPGAPVRARPAGPASERRDASAGLFPGLEPAPSAPPADDPDFDLDDIPF